ncbi:gp630 [Bacillus phage G]|uniref:Gp630 n=1 Tax=Bacillus phage G TaxID=2884420 RepID=G3MB10_9CAUD|nr:gp630 [Bacillus phage G]AEO93875.1 gp630 [Bacillus phage G]
MTLITNEIKEKIEQLVISKKQARRLAYTVQETEKYIERNERGLAGAKEALEELEKHDNKFPIGIGLMSGQIEEFSNALKHNKFERDRAFQYLTNILNKGENFVHKAE